MGEAGWFSNFVPIAIFCPTPYRSVYSVVRLPLCDPVTLWRIKNILRKVG